MYKYTEAEKNMVREYAQIMTGHNSGPIFKKKVGATIIKIEELMDRYGEDGHGDKPDNMNRVEYWLAHLTE